MMHAYTRFRIKLTLNSLAQLGARLRSSGEIVLLALGPAIFGLLACAALPPMFAASYPLFPALGLLLLHAGLMTLPAALLLPRLLPGQVRAWLYPLPVPPGLLLRTSMLVAGLLVVPLALAYAGSLAIWMAQGQRPEWLLPGRATGATLLSLLLTWAATSALLYRAALLPPALRPRPLQPGAGAYAPHPRPGWPMLWYRLFWLPLWRRGSLAGPRQALLLAGTCIAIALWMAGPALLPKVAGAVLASVLLVLLVHEADDALRIQLARLQVTTASLPLDPRILGRRARLSLLGALALPLAALTVAGLAAQAWGHTAGRLYLALAWTVAPLLVCTPALTPRGRMGLVAFSIMLLCAIGSKVWH